MPVGWPAPAPPVAPAARLARRAPRLLGGDDVHLVAAGERRAQRVGDARVDGVGREPPREVGRDPLVAHAAKEAHQLPPVEAPPRHGLVQHARVPSGEHRLGRGALVEAADLHHVLVAGRRGACVCVWGGVRVSHACAAHALAEGGRLRRRPAPLPRRPRRTPAAHTRAPPPPRAPGLHDGAHRAHGLHEARLRGLRLGRGKDLRPLARRRLGVGGRLALALGTGARAWRAAPPPPCARWPSCRGCGGGCRAAPPPRAAP